MKNLRRLPSAPRQWFVITRQGLFATARRTAPRNALAPAARLGWLLVGSLVIGAGAALMIDARFGLSPYDVLLAGTTRHVPLSHGQAAWAVSGLLLAVALLLGQRPKLPTVLLILVSGAAVDAVGVLVVEPEGLVARVLFVATGMALLAGGIAIVIHSNSTGGSFEMLMQAGAERGLDPMRVRTFLEVMVVVCGVAAGGPLGVATVVYAVGIGPLIAVMLRALADHRAGRDARLASTDADLPVSAARR